LVFSIVDLLYRCWEQFYKKPSAENNVKFSFISINTFRMAIVNVLSYL